MHEEVLKLYGYILWRIEKSDGSKCISEKDKKNKKRIVRQKTKRRISVTYSLPTYIPTIRFAIGHPLKRTYSEDLLIKYVQKQVRIRQYFSKNIQKLSKSPIKSTKQT